MQKTKLGISAGMLAAVIYLTALFSGYWVAIFLAGYVLLFEENQWLKISAIKAVGILLFFSFLSTVIHLIPDALDVVSYFGNMFGTVLSFGPVNPFIYAVLGIVDIVEKILFLVLGVKAFEQRTIAFPVVDKLISKYVKLN